MKTAIKIILLCTVYFSLTYGMSIPPAAAPPPQFVSAKITGPPHQAPLFLSDTNAVTLFTRISFFNPSLVDGKAHIEGTSEDYINADNKNNLTWQVSNFAFNAGIDVKTWSFLAFFATLKIDNREDGICFTGSDFGLGLIISPDKNFQARLDLGLTYLSMDMDATLARLDNNHDTTYFKVTNNETGLDPFASLTMNTKFENWIINPFFQASYCNQTLFNITAPSYGYSSNTNLFTLTPGITYRLSNNILIILGGSYIMPSNIENLSSKAVYSGFLQANFLLEQN